MTYNWLLVLNTITNSNTWYNFLNIFLHGHQLLTILIVQKGTRLYTKKPEILLGGSTGYLIYCTCCRLVKLPTFSKRSQRFVQNTHISNKINLCWQINVSGTKARNIIQSSSFKNKSISLDSLRLSFPMLYTLIITNTSWG